MLSEAELLPLKEDLKSLADSLALPDLSCSSLKMTHPPLSPVMSRCPRELGLHPTLTWLTSTHPPDLSFSVVSSRGSRQSGHEYLLDHPSLSTLFSPLPSQGCWGVTPTCGHITHRTKSQQPRSLTVTTIGSKPLVSFTRVSPATDI